MGKIKKEYLPWHWKITLTSGITLENENYVLMERRNGFVYFYYRYVTKEKYTIKRFLRKAIIQTKTKQHDDLQLVIAEFHIAMMEVMYND